MRYRLMASYLGASYQAAVGPSDRDVTLFAAPPPPEEHGFSPAPGGVWRKQVRLGDLDALWESRPIGSYHGEPCLVLDDLGDRVHIVYLGMDERRAGQLGYWQVDRGVFEVVVPRADVTDLAEERHEFPIALLLSALPRALSAGDGGRTAAGAPGGQHAGSGPLAGSGQGLGNGQHASSGRGLGNGQHAGNGQSLGTYQLPVSAPQLPPSPQLPVSPQLPQSSPQLPPSSPQLPAAQAGGAQQGQTSPLPTAPLHPGSKPPPSAAAWHGSPGADAAGPWYHPAGNGTIGQNGAQSYAANGNGAGLPNGYGNDSQNGFGQPPGGFPPPPNGLAGAPSAYSPGTPPQTLPAPPQSGHAFEEPQQAPATPAGQQGGQAGRGQQPTSQ